MNITPEMLEAGKAAMLNAGGQARTTDQMIAAIYTAMQAKAWQPIETAPKDGTNIDLWVIGDEYTGRLPDCEWAKLVGAGGSFMSWMWDGFGIERTYQPTHWQPLPNPPSE